MNLLLLFWWFMLGAFTLPYTLNLPTCAESIPIKKGYVAFGDSYAAGIGTGTTAMGGCRQGQYSYPRQLAAMAPVNIDFQNLPCSGAIIGDILQGGHNSQIDA
ncbi:hypothetical protein MMC14_006394 [Varicellaria rhodocarpa]|nr:hypothetical protein [Varicellaria rhodocarpa]